MEKAVLAVENLHKTFISGTTELPVLCGITATFEQGASYAITGVSGSGKSTFIHLMAGLDSPTSGTVSFNHENLATMSPGAKDRFLQHSIGLVFQLPYLIGELSVLENVMVKGLVAGQSLAQSRAHALELLKAVRLADKASSKPYSLSGGQQQRVALARALFSKPAFLLADEPTGNLDERTGRAIVQLLLTCQQEWGMGIVVSSHDAYVAEYMGTMYQLHDGKMTIKA